MRAIAAIGAVLSTSCAGVRDDAPRTLTPQVLSLSWRGSAAGLPVSSSADLENRRRHGQSAKFSLALGDGYWEQHAGVVQIAVRWQRRGELVSEPTGRLLGLWLTDADGSVLAKGSTDPNDLATAQVIDGGALRDGDYEVIVAPLRDSQVTDYEVSVTVSERTTADARPDLATNQPVNLRFATFGSRSCLDVEVVGKRGLSRCLRFDATIANRGGGPFVVEADIADVLEEGFERDAEPRGRAVHVLPDGERRRTGRWVIDREHAHVHIEDLMSYELYSVSRDGRRELLLTDEKIGFCPWDLTNERFGQRGNAERKYRPTACNVSRSDDDEAGGARVLGISGGWADVYPANRAAQFLDASRVDDGVYDVAVRVDPTEAFDELDEANNEETTRIRIEGSRITCIAEPYGCPARVVG